MKYSALKATAPLAVAPFIPIATLAQNLCAFLNSSAVILVHDLQHTYLSCISATHASVSRLHPIYLKRAVN